MRAMTESQKEFHETILVHYRKYGYGPTIRELAKHYSVTPFAIYCRLKWLVKKGVLKPLEHRKSRTIVPTCLKQQTEGAGRFVFWDTNVQN